MPAKFNLNRGTYSGQFGMLYIEPKNDPGQYDAEIPLLLHDWDPHLTGEEGGVEEVSYKLYSINSPLHSATAIPCVFARAKKCCSAS